MPELFQALEAGRVDSQLAGLLDVSRGLAQEFIAEDRVLVDGETVTDKSRSVRPGEKISVDLNGVDLEAGVEPESGALEVLYEDEFLLAVNKPSDIIVHPVGSPRKRGSVMTGTLVNRLLYHYPGLSDVGGPRRAGLVHRLDRGTSGVLLVARDTETLNKLQAQFKRRSVEKKYRAVGTGELDREKVLVEVPIGRDPDNPLLRKPSPEGKFAATRFKRAGKQGSKVALECFPKTGRTHQVRVHASYIEVPLVGDKKYGGCSAERLMLHAETLSFTHPHEDESVEIKSNPPEVFARLWEDVTR